MGSMFAWLLDRRVRSWQYALIEKHCEEVQHMYQEMRTWRHDYKNHLQVMKAHLELGEYEKLADYLGELDREISQMDYFIKTGNVMLDAVLNSKISLARSKQIRVDVKVVLPAHLVINHYDLSVILGNLLDNAIEGCETQSEEKERFLRVYIGMLKEQLYLSVTNSHCTPVLKSKNGYLSTKAKDRGLGTLSIDRIVARHKGFVNRKNDELIFATERLLPL